MLNHIAIVGASAAGISAAEALRQQGFDGRVTLIGAEDHLPYDRPPLSKQLLSGAWEPERLTLRPRERIDEWGIDLRLGTAATGLDVDARVLDLDDGTRVGFDGVIIACGVAARRLPGETPEGVHYLRTLDDALAMRARLNAGGRLLVVGAGFIGAEAASVARERGMEVTMVDPLRAPMVTALGDVIADHLAELHKRHGVDVRCGTGVRELTASGGHVDGAILHDGSRVDADVVVVGIGTVPATGWLADSGLLRDGAVACDQYCAAAPGVYAAGDVASWYHPLFDARVRVEHRTSAGESGRLAAINLLGDNPRAFDSVPYFWSDQYDTKLQAWGQVGADLDFAVVDGDVASGRFVAAYGRAGRIVGAVGSGMVKPLMGLRALIAARGDMPAAVGQRG
ncbi:MAG TPA: FAD-dependent oxidoreductase [Stackebrandtia sp.]|uniref:NAD(P)/FAD-dependent oxidoreductase n=1 Tax=Stackebrandtia sp. TaxID=2023065 RepID=UPI002D704708|nr:FAD-dependent oxidoreductase [Stackebrandtia sp.]HZE40825.1 FAD-dependent oxidoreductase [Stackebrandtia sp.]